MATQRAALEQMFAAPQRAAEHNAFLRAIHSAQETTINVIVRSKLAIEESRALLNEIDRHCRSRGLEWPFQH